MYGLSEGIGDYDWHLQPPNNQSFLCREACKAFTPTTLAQNSSDNSYLQWINLIKWVNIVLLLIVYWVNFVLYLTPILVLTLMLKLYKFPAQITLILPFPLEHF